MSDSSPPGPSDKCAKRTKRSQDESSPLVPELLSKDHRKVKPLTDLTTRDSRYRAVKRRLDLTPQTLSDSSDASEATCSDKLACSQVFTQPEAEELLVDTGGTSFTNLGLPAEQLITDENSQTSSCDELSSQGVDDSILDFLTWDFQKLLTYADMCDDWNVDIASLLPPMDDPDEEFDISLFLEGIDRFDFENDAESSDNASDEAGVETLCDKVRLILHDWVLCERVPHSKTDALLRSLKSLPELSSLPATTVTLIKTPRGKIKSKNVSGGGEYVHIGIKKNLELLLAEQTSAHIEIFWITDGISIFKSKGSELWPILCRITSIPSLSHIVFAVGFYYNSSKPKRPEFLKDFCKEAEDLIRDGLTINQHCFTVSFGCFVADGPAKAMALGIKSCNAKASCTKCHVYGCWSYSSHRVYYTAEDAALRTHAEFLEQSDLEFHKYDTPLTTISTMDFPKTVALDYMHLILLGVFRTMVYLWLIGKLPHKISPSCRMIISDRLKGMKLFAPKEFVRKPRSAEEVCYYKATEWRQLLLYTGIVVFRKQVSDAKYNNFLTLSIATRIVLDPKNLGNDELISYAHKLFLHFLSTFREEYGDDYITHNFHNLCHVCNELKNVKNLEESSAFPFENFMQFIKALVRKSSDVLPQLVRRIEELIQSRMLFKQVKPVYYEKPEYFSAHKESPLLQRLGNPQFEFFKLKFFELSRTEPENCCTTDDGAIVRILNICFDKECQRMVIVGKAYLEKKDYFVTPCESSKFGIYRVSNLSTSLKIWPVDTVVSKNYAMPVKNGWCTIPMM